jgi:multicomponent Na+:H+ antiporter subunit A
MGGMGVLFGIIPGWVSDHLIEPAVLAFHPAREDLTLALFHGVNLPLLLSAGTLTLGGLAYRFRSGLGSRVQDLTGRLGVTASDRFQATLGAFLRLASAITARVQGGSLHTYLWTILASVVLLAGWAFAPRAASLFDPAFPFVRPSWVEAGLLAFILAATAVVLTARRRLAAAGGSGAVGAGVALVFLVSGAPDVALTQLLVETLTLIILCLVLFRLPPMGDPPGRGRVRTFMNIFVSAGAGLLVTSLVMGLLGVEMDRSVTAFFETASFSEAHGRNIVNVILVDFRSLDTLGEITVVVLAAWSALALVRKTGGG